MEPYISPKLYRVRDEKNSQPVLSQLVFRHKALVPSRDLGVGSQLLLTLAPTGNPSEGPVGGGDMFP